MGTGSAGPNVTGFASVGFFLGQRLFAKASDKVIPGKKVGPLGKIFRKSRVFGKNVGEVWSLLM